MRLVKLLLVPVLALCLTGCGGCRERPKEEQEEKQRQYVPILVCEKDGVRVYKVYDSTEGGTSYIYFTVPVGTTHWTTEDSEGNVTHHQVAGPQTGAPKKK
jgi:hypothetical protein